MEALISLDIYFFLLINHLPHSEIVNSIAQGLSGIGKWGAIWIVLGFFLFLREEVRDHLFFVPFITVGILCAVSEFMLKWFVARPRPSAQIGAIILDTPGNYSFPSTHATLSFAFAYILTRVEPKLRLFSYILAAAISFTRVYLGVHYPIDVIGGFLLGTLVGRVSVGLQKYWYNRPHETKRKTASNRRI